jgi:tRNA(Arg) A34 adenosine deaminase TadA
MYLACHISFAIFEPCVFPFMAIDPVKATVELPQWLASLDQGQLHLHGSSDAVRMQLAIELAQRNVAEGTGGPFGAIVVEESTGLCVAAGVNLVVASGLSLAHAEVVAIMRAQLQAGTFDLAGEAQRRYTLYASGQPCIMCFGVLWWSGITRLVCAARGEDVESITTFREGPLPEHWPQLLSQRTGLPPIEVVRDVLREEACDLLRAYVAADNPVYNPGSTAGN